MDDLAILEAQRIASERKVNSRWKIGWTRYVLQWIPGIALARVHALLTMIGDETPSRVLAVGPRDELELIAIRRHFRKAKVMGLDLFSGCASIRVGSMECLPFASGIFDLVVSCHSLEHSVDPHQALREMGRVLAPGGLLAIEIPIAASTDRSGGPVRFPGDGADRWNFKNVDTLITAVLCAGWPVHIADRFEDRQTVRVIARKAP